MTPRTRLNLAPSGLVGKLAGLARAYRSLNWALGDQALVSACNFFTAVVLARYLGLAEFGRYTLAWSVVLFGLTLHASILISPMMSIATKQAKDSLPGYFGALALQHLVFVSIVFVFITGGGLIADPIFPSWRAGALALPLGCAAVAYKFHDMLRGYFFTKGLVSRAFWMDTVRYPGQLAALVAVTQLGNLDVRNALWVFTGGSALSFCLFVRYLEPISWDGPIARKTIARHWNFSKWLVFGALMTWIGSNVFLVAAGALLGASAVGAVNATRTLLGGVHILVFGLGNIAPVRAARHFHENGVAALRRYLGRVALLSGGSTLAIGIVATATPEFWLRLVFGAEYAGYGFLMVWWAFIYLALAINLPLRAGLAAIERNRAVFVVAIFTTLFGLLFAYEIVNQLGVLGVVVGFLATSFLRNGILALSLFRNLKQLGLAELAKPEASKPQGG